MKDYSREYTEKQDGFDGNCEAYLIPTEKENLYNWLSKEIESPETIYNALKILAKDILIIKNINVDESFRGQGNGGQILCDVICDSYADAAILLCDIGESQKEGFILEKFYEENNFKTVLMHNNYPLMIYPEKLAEKVIEKISSTSNIVYKKKL